MTFPSSWLYRFLVCCWEDNDTRNSRNTGTSGNVAHTLRIACARSGCLAVGGGMPCTTSGSAGRLGPRRRPRQPRTVGLVRRGCGSSRTGITGRWSLCAPSRARHFPPSPRLIGRRTLTGLRVPVRLGPGLPDPPGSSQVGGCHVGCATFHTEIVMSKGEPTGVGTESSDSLRSQSRLMIMRATWTLL